MEIKIIRFGGVVLNREVNTQDSISVFPPDLVMEIKMELIWERDAGKKSKINSYLYLSHVINRLAPNLH